MSTTPAALVTGASRGLGRAFAWALAQRQHPLVLTARSAPDLEQLAAQLRQRFAANVRVCVADLAHADGPRQLAEATADQPLDLLINNAGVGLAGPLAAQDPERLGRLLQLNVVAPTLLCRLLADRLVASRGAIVQVASTAAMQPIPGLAAYAASKAYLLSLSVALGQELRADGVRVLAICPGPTRTEFFAAADWRPPLPPAKLAEADEVVALALSALARGRPVAVHGWQNRLGAWVAQAVPRTWAARAAERLCRPQPDSSPPRP